MNSDRIKDFSINLVMSPTPTRNVLVQHHDTVFFKNQELIYNLGCHGIILSTLEDFSLTEKHARVLLASETPLEEIYRIHNRDWDSARKRIEETIQYYAEGLVERNAINVATAVYPHSEMSAEKFGEWELYQQSTHLNIQCKEAIDDVIHRY